MLETDSKLELLLLFSKAYNGRGSLLKKMNNELAKRITPEMRSIDPKAKQEAKTNFNGFLSSNLRLLFIQLRSIIVSAQKRTPAILRAERTREMPPRNCQVTCIITDFKSAWLTSP